MNDDTKAARDTLSIALQSSQTIFQQVVKKCAEWEIISQTDFSHLNAEPTVVVDYTGPLSLAQRVALLVDLLVPPSLENVDLPNTLDNILCALHESGSPVVQEVAETIAKEYSQFNLPKYNGLSPCPATPSRKAKWHVRVLKCVFRVMVGVAIIYFILGFTSIWLPKIVLRILAYVLTFVAFIAVTVGLIVAYEIGYDIIKLQTFIVGIMFGLFEPVILDIWKKVSE